MDNGILNREMSRKSALAPCWNRNAGDVIKGF